MRNSFVQTTGRVLVVLSLLLTALVWNTIPASAQAGPTVSAGDIEVTELNGTPGIAYKNAHIPFTLSEPNPNSAVTVHFTTVETGSAVGGSGAGSDFEPRSSFVVIPVNQLTRTKAVKVWGDTVPEPTETFEVHITSVENASIDDGVSVVTIIDNDGYVPPTGPQISIGDVSPGEGDGNAVLTLTLDSTPTQQVDVQVDTADGTATAPGDYAAVVAQTVSFVPPATTAILNIPLVDDGDDESPSENFTVNLSNPVNGGIADSQATVTIVDDDGVPPVPQISIGDVSPGEGDGNAVLTLSLDIEPTQQVDVQVDTADGTAVAPGDYGAVVGQTVSFVPPATTATLNVSLVDDGDDETPSEDFFVNLSNPVNGAIADNQATVTIVDDDGPAGPTVSAGDISVNELNGTPGVAYKNAHIPFTLSEPNPSSAVTVNFTTVETGSAVGGPGAGSDFEPRTDSVVIPIGQLTRTKAVKVWGDTVPEPTETFEVHITSVVNAGIGDGVAVVTILDNDGYVPPTGPQISIGDVSPGEGDGNAVLTLTLDSTPTQQVDVQVDTADGTATAPADYAAVVAQTVSFVPPATTATLNIPLVDDGDDESPSENFTVNLSNPVNGGIADSQATVTIIDDDAPPPTPQISIGDVSPGEGDGNAVLTLSLDITPTQQVDVQVDTADGTATAPADYAAVVAQTVSFVPPATTATLSIPIVDDGVDESPSEDFFVNLSNAVNGAIADNQATVTIVDDDAPPPTPQITIADVSPGEGDGNAVLTLSLDITPSQQVDVQVDTADGTATAPGDYAAVVAQTVSFVPPATTATLSIPIVDDGIDETPSEDFFVNLSNAVNGAIADNQATVTIVDDDGPAGPTVSAGDIDVNELNGTPGIAYKNAHIPFTLSEPNPNSAVTVHFTTVETGSAVGGSGAGSDFEPRVDSVVIPINQLTRTKAVKVWGDTVPEPTETFEVHITSVENAGIGDGVSVVTILDNDGYVPPTDPQISIGDVSPGEGDGNAVLTLSLDIEPTSQVDVQVDTADGTATSPADYAAVVAQTVSFVPPAMTATLNIPIVDDGDDESPSENFTVNLSNPVNGGIADSLATVTIIDDDAPPQISIGDVSPGEGDGNAVLTLSLDKAPTAQVDVQVDTSDGTATAPGDYAAVVAQTVSFVPPATTATLNIPIVDDGDDETPSEDFFVDLSNAVNGAIADNQATVTIVDDDGTVPTPQISIADVNPGEGDGNAFLTLSLDIVPSQQVDVQVDTADGTATAPADYGAVVAQTVSFVPPATTATVNVPLVDDGDIETPSEIFTVNLSNAVNGVIADNQATVTIVDDDSPTGPTVSVGDVSATELNGTPGVAFKNVHVPFTLSETVGSSVRVDFTTMDIGSATEGGATYVAGDDYVGRTDFVVIPSGELTRTKAVKVWGDSDPEPDETLEVHITAVTEVAILDGVGVVTIFDNDGPPDPQISIADVSPGEGDGNAVLTLSLDIAPTSQVDVQVDTADGTANAPADYAAVVAQTVSFVPPATTATLNIPIVDDGDDESPSEDFFVNLSNPVNADIGDGQATVTIIDDDGSPGVRQISIADATVTEGDGSPPNDFVTVDLILTLDAPATQQVDVEIDSLATGTATPGVDFEAIVDQVVTFAVNDDTATFTAKVYGDLDQEGQEDFDVQLSNPVNGIIVDGDANVIIFDNEFDPNLPNLRIHDGFVTEGNAGERNVEVIFSLESPSTDTVRVDMTTVPDTATEGVAIGDGDYQDRTEQLIFGPGDQILKRIIKINGDTEFEGNETLKILLSNPENANIADPEGILTILDNEEDPNGPSDPGPGIYIQDVTQLEGGQGGWRNAEVVFLLDQPSDVSVRVNFNTVDGNMGNGTDATLADGDYQDAATHLGNPDGDGPLLVFAPGNQILKRNIRILGQTPPQTEGPETFRVVLSNPENAVIADGEALVTILDLQEPPGIPQVSVVDSFDVEGGDAGTENATVKFFLDRPSTTTVRVDFSPADDTLTLANGDYNLPNPGSETITFPAGTQVAEKNIIINRDTTYGGTQGLFVNLSNPDGLTILDGQGYLTIFDDEEDPTPPPSEDLPAVHVIGAVNNEVNNANVKLYLDKPYTGTVRVDFVTQDVTATTAENDYSFKSGTVTFAEGEQVAETNVAVTPDNWFEGTETFKLILSNPQGATIGSDDGEAIIYDDEVPGDPPEPIFEFADLGVTITPDVTTAAPGDTVVYTVDVTNNGPDTAVNARSTATLPSGMTFVATSGCTEDPNGQTCSLGDLTSGASASYTLTATVNPLTFGTLTTSVTVENDAIDNVSANDTGSADVDSPSPWANDVVYLSSTSGGNANGVTFTDEDILAYDRSTGQWSMFFDGSDVGITTLDGFNIVDFTPGATVIEMTFATPRTLDGVSYDDSDVVVFTGTTGATTSGTFAMGVDGSTIGLTTSGEDIDALARIGNDYVFSFLATFNALGLAGADEDLARYSPAGGTLSMHLDGSTVDLTAEDVIATWIDPNDGYMYMSSIGNVNVPGFTGDSDDVFVLTDPVNGLYGLYLDGDAIGFNNENIDGIHIVRP